MRFANGLDGHAAPEGRGMILQAGLALAVFSAVLFAGLAPPLSGQSNPTKEYIRAGGKLIAIEIPGAAGPITVSVTPTTVSLGPGGTQQFTKSVTGTSNQSVTWSVLSGLGTISGAGLYTAPSSISSTSTAKVRATSVADSSKWDEATVTLLPPANPAITGFTPLNQTGYDVTFSMLAQGGGYPVDALQVFTDKPFDGVGGCLVWYQQSDGRLYLGGNGDPYTWVGSVGLNTSQVVQNNQCTLYGSGSSRTINGNQTSLSIHVQFKTAFAGLREVRTWIRNTNSQETGWDHIGDWTVGAPPSGVSPATGSTFPNQLLQLTANTTPPGAAVNWTLSPALGTITGQGLYTAPVTIGSQQNITATARLASTNALIGTATVTLKPVTGSGGSPSYIYSLPNGQSGFADVFRFNWRDPQGANSIDEARVRFSNTSSGGTNANICSFRWTRANNQFELYNDAGTALLPPIVKGSADAENSSCRLVSQGINSLMWQAGDGEHWEIQVGIGFKTPFASGTKYIQMWARDNTGRESAWENAGTHEFPSNSTIPSIHSVTPAAGSYTAVQTFKVVATDASGESDIDGFQFVIGSTATFPSPNACHVFYFRDSNYAVLLGNDPTTWAGVSEIAPWAENLNNSQCMVNVKESGKGNESGVANSFFFQPKVQIKTPFLGSRKIWVLAVDNAGNHTGYQYVGQFNFTSAGLYDLELTPYYRHDPASGKRELWVRAEARRLPRGGTRANPENPRLEAQ